MIKTDFSIHLHIIHFIVSCRYSRCIDMYFILNIRNNKMNDIQTFRIMNLWFRKYRALNSVFSYLYIFYFSIFNKYICIFCILKFLNFCIFSHPLSVPFSGLKLGFSLDSVLSIEQLLSCIGLVVTSILRSPRNIHGAPLCHILYDHSMYLTLMYIVYGRHTGVDVKPIYYICYDSSLVL